ATDDTPGDLDGDGSGHRLGAAFANGSLSGLVSFGADGHAVDASGGNAGFQFAVADGSSHDFGVTSHGQEVDYVTLSAVTDGADGAAQTLTAWTDGGPNGPDGGGHEVFTLTLDGDRTYTFTLINPLHDRPRQDDSAT